MPTQPRTRVRTRRPSNLASDPRVLARSELLILRLLREHGPTYGLRLVALSDGALTQNGVYTTLGRMAEKGLVESWITRGPERGGTPLRVYRETEHGARVLDATEAYAQATANRG